MMNCLTMSKLNIGSEASFSSALPSPLKFTTYFITLRAHSDGRVNNVHGRTSYHGIEALWKFMLFPAETPFPAELTLLGRVARHERTVLVVLRVRCHLVMSFSDLFAFSFTFVFTFAQIINCFQLAAFTVFLQDGEGPYVCGHVCRDFCLTILNDADN